MLDPKEVLYGLPINEIARLANVDLTTARRWKRGATCPPQSALSLLTGDLGYFDPAWQGWKLRNGSLWSPEGWGIRMSDVLASRLHEAQLAAWRVEVRVLRARVAELEMTNLDEQPTPDQWDIQILTG